MSFAGFTNFEQKYGSFINLVVKPLCMAFIALSLFAYNGWLNSNYTPRPEFAAYVVEQREQSDSQNKIVNNKLEIIINNQTIYNEQMKGLNTLLAHQQNQITGLGERLTYLERRK